MLGQSPISPSAVAEELPRHLRDLKAQFANLSEIGVDSKCGRAGGDCGPCERPALQDLDRSTSLLYKVRFGVANTRASRGSNSLNGSVSARASKAGLS